MKKRSHRHEKMARVYDDEILPIWSQKFGRMLLRSLEVPPKAMILDVNCGTGYPSLEILKRMDDNGRIIAIDPIGPLLDVARKKAGALAGRRIFFRSEPPTAKLAFADDVYDLLLDDPPLAVKEFARVAKPGGMVIVTLPLAGTYNEFFDIYREVLTKNDKHDVLERLELHISQAPDPERAVSWFEEAGLTKVEVEVERFSLLFASSREFFFAPVVEFGPLGAWKEIAGKGQEMQEIFWHIKESIDAYFGGRAFELTVKSGCVKGVKPPKGAATQEKQVKSDNTSKAGKISKPIKPSAEAAKSPSSVSVSKLQGKDNFQLDEEEEPQG
jgi:ubiquinone/menaquinone biosynthesis C-methylase UbiE